MRNLSFPSWTIGTDSTYLGVMRVPILTRQEDVEAAVELAGQGREALDVDVAIQAEAMASNLTIALHSWTSYMYTLSTSTLSFTDTRVYTLP